ncbi:MAG: protein BatD, partial [Deltaproteobacteria bacterium]|nr:protein BatD [Deltaproteobacteria bacterium]
MTQQSHPQRRAPSSRTPPRAAFRIILALAASLSLTVGTRDAHAQNATIRLSVDKHLVGVAEAVQITVQLSVAGRASYTQYVPPKMDGFRVSSQGMTSQNIAVVNWHIRRRESYAYTAIPVKLGTFKIGPAAIHVGKRWIRSNVETITVKRGAGSPQTPRPGFSSPPGNAPPTATGVPSGVPTQRVFIMGSVTPQKAYVGQQVVALWQLYTQSDVLGFRTLKQPTTDGFWSDDLKSPRRLEFARHVVQGRIYYLATLAKKALFPQRPGKLTIGPMGAMVRTLDTFSTSSKRHSDPLTIEVLPLPAQGKPKAFPEQNVGHYAMTATLDRKTIKAGDAVTLKIIVRGTGNLRQLAIPKLTTIPGLRIYEPKTTDHIDNTSRIAGEKTIEYLLLPTRAGKIAIPRLVLTYFDPRTQRYRKAQSRILTLTVRGKFSGAPQTTG